MKTISISVSKNYRTSNDDQYARTTFVHNIDLEEGETKQDATLRAIKELDEIFCIAYPYVYPYLNFHVVKQARVNHNDEKTNFDEVIQISQPVHIVSQPQDKFTHKWETINGNPIVTEKENKPTIEEPIDKDFNLINEMKNCKTAKELKTFCLLTITPEEKEFYKNKLDLLKSKLQTT